MTFTIDQVYKAISPRGQFYRGSVTEWSTSGTTSVVVSATTDPVNWAVSIGWIRFLETSLTTSGTGTGIFQLEYPDYVGESVNTFLVNSITDLKHFADSVVQANSSTYYVFKLDPPILLKATNSVSQATFSWPDYVTLDSGNLAFLPIGWTIKESDYD